MNAAKNGVKLYINRYNESLCKTFQLKKKKS